MTETRHTASTITDDALDALYRRIATLEHVAAGNRRHVQLIVPELEQAEAAVERVRAIHTRYADSGHCQHDSEPWPCPTLTALGKPSASAATEATHNEEGRT